MPVNAPEPPPGTLLAQVRCPKGHPQWVITSHHDPIGVGHLICPKCGLRFTLIMPRVMPQSRKTMTPRLAARRVKKVG